MVTLLLQHLRVMLADVQETSATVCTRGQWRSSWLNMGTLVQQCLPGSKLSMIITDRRWPSASQQQAALEAIAHNHNISKVALSLAEQVEELDSKHAHSFARVVHALAHSLSAAPHVSSLHLSTGYLPSKAQLASISNSLAQLTSLQHLTYTGAELSKHCVSPWVPSLTTLTSLHLTLGDKTFKDRPQLQPLLQQLAQLSRLQALKLATEVWCSPGDSVVLLPTWPELQELHLECGSSACYNLQLSAQHCARLESLTAHQFHAAPGVASLAKLRHLKLACGPAMPSEDELWQAHAGAGHLVLPQQVAVASQLGCPQQLQLPSLHHLVFTGQPASSRSSGTGSEAASVAQQVLFLLLQAPAITSIGMQQLQPDAADSLALQRGLLQLLANRTALRSLRLPGWQQQQAAAQPADRPGSMFTHQLLSLAAQQCQLQELALQQPLPAEQHRLLQACSSLRDLSLSSATPGVLAHLPPELTALTVIPSAPSAAAPAQHDPTSISSKAQQHRHRTARPPQLQKLCTDQPELVFQSLPLSHLTSLTSLTGTAASGAVLGQLSAKSAAGISNFTRLSQLHVRPWPGMASQLAQLPHLGSLVVRMRHRPEMLVLEQQVQQMGALTQLKQLVLGHCLEAAYPVRKELALKVVRALPHCLVRMQCLVSEAW